MRKGKRKVIKFFTNYHKELKWLEEMALQGWFLDNITFGCIYSLEKGEPRRMVYDMDRFNLSKKPSLEEIRRKEMFMDMAQEMGWQEVTHSEQLTYYFSREYEEGGINHLHNDEESRRYRAENFKAYLTGQAKRYVFWVLVIVVVDIILKILRLPGKEHYLEWFDWFVLVYAASGNGIAIRCWRRGAQYGKDLSMTREEWERSVDPATHKVVRKLLLTNRGLNRFLGRQAESGWILASLTPTRYFFEKSNGTKQVYTMDSKWLVNKRRENFGERKIGDKKDWCGLNNDWEIQSVHDAEEKGWVFVCALENRGIIYKGEAGRTEALNDEKYDKKLRWISLIGEYGFYLFLCGLAGGIIGFFMGYCHI